MVGLYRSMDHGHWMRDLRLSVICGNIMPKQRLLAWLVSPTVPTSLRLSSNFCAFKSDLKAEHDLFENRFCL